ncbi:MAG: hypothetical protein R2827_00300 [Bdellovibrionales bacterium]
MNFIPTECTTQSTPLEFLVFVSIMERQAVVLGDEPTSSKLPPEKWSEVIQTLIQGIKKKKISAGFVDAIAMSGSLLQAHFPISEKTIQMSFLIIASY